MPFKLLIFLHLVKMSMRLKLREEEVVVDLEVEEVVIQEVLEEVVEVSKEEKLRKLEI